MSKSAQRVQLAAAAKSRALSVRLLESVAQLMMSGLPGNKQCGLEEEQNIK
jgi:hypothetical protein